MATGEEQRAVEALRAARRQRLRASFDWVDATYRAYLTAGAAVAATLLLSGALGDARASSAQQHNVATYGPAIAGCLLAVLVAAALRGGSRGGPLVIEAADVQHLLLAPVDRGLALRGTVLRQLRSRVFVALVTGAVAGNLAFRRLPGKPGAWIGCLALFSLLSATAAHAAAVIASGRRVKRRPATVAGLVLVLWSAADVALRAETSPATYAGRLAVLPLRHGGTDFAASALFAVVASAAVAAGLAWVGGTSLELARRRAELVAGLRFAVTLGDIRAVVLVRRQLASELPRRRPWIRLSSRPTRSPAWRRSWQSFLRWPAVRVGRVAAAGVVAGLAAAGAWDTTPLLAVAGLALLVVAFDATEPFAQEIDHPTRRDMLPVEGRRLARRHLAAPLVLTSGVCLVGVAAALAVAPAGKVLPIGLATAVSASLAAVTAAAFSAGGDSLRWVLTPGVNNAKTAAPFVIAILGVLPIAAAHAAERAHQPPGQAAVSAAMILAVVCSGVLAFAVHQAAPRSAPMP